MVRPRQTGSAASSYPASAPSAASAASMQVKCSPSLSPSPSPSWDLIIHTAGDYHLTRSTSPSPSFRKTHGLCCGAMPGTSLTQGCPRSPSAAPPRPAPSLSEIPWALIGWRSYSRGDDAVVRVDEGASASICSTPPTAIAAWPAHTAHEGDSSQPSFVCHHPWDTIMIHAETIALAGLVNSLHTSRPVPRSLRYQARENRKRDYEVLDAFVTGI